MWNQFRRNNDRVFKLYYMNDTTRLCFKSVQLFLYLPTKQMIKKNLKLKITKYVRIFILNSLLNFIFGWKAKIITISRAMNNLFGSNLIYGSGSTHRLLASIHFTGFRQWNIYFDLFKIFFRVSHKLQKDLSLNL